ncbi:MAG: hypothetical protein AAF367_09960 [Pseudomonadota bacterium]
MAGTDDFLKLSALLTGYNGASLASTGCADEYFRQLAAVAGDLTAPLLEWGVRIETIRHDDPAEAQRLAREHILSDADLGPLARALMKLWYLGQWEPMPPDWVARNGLSDQDTARILSTRSYQEGLVWDAMGAHPMGAKQQGFGAWALTPPAPRTGPLGG